MDWSSSDLGDAFGLFKQKLDLYLEDEEIMDDAAKARKFLRGSSGLTDEEKKNLDELYGFFERNLKISVNFRIHRLHLMQFRQNKDESLDDFITQARTLALKCEFSEEELSERLLELIITPKATRRTAADNTAGTSTTPTARPTQVQTSEKAKQNCQFNHQWGGGIFRWRICRAVLCSHYQWTSTPSASHGMRLTPCLEWDPRIIWRHTRRLKLDTGAAGNTLPIRTFHQMYGKGRLNCDIVEPAPDIKLVSYSGDRIKCHGKISIPCKYRGPVWETIMFYIVDVPGPAILGLRNSQSLGIVTLNVDEVTPKTTVKRAGQPRLDDLSDAKRAFPDQFDRMGDFECDEDLEVKEDARGSIDAPRKTLYISKTHSRPALTRWKLTGSSVKSQNIQSGAPVWYTARRRTAASGSALIPKSWTKASSDAPTKFQQSKNSTYCSQTQKSSANWTLKIITSKIILRYDDFPTLQLLLCAIWGHTSKHKQEYDDPS